MLKVATPLSATGFPSATPTRSRDPLDYQDVGGIVVSVSNKKSHIFEGAGAGQTRFEHYAYAPKASLEKFYPTQ